MIGIQVNETKMNPDRIKAGTKGSYYETIRFSFTGEWVRLNKKAVFYPVRGKPVEVSLGRSNYGSTKIPPEVMEYSGIAKFVVSGYVIEDGKIDEKIITLPGFIEVDATLKDEGANSFPPTPNTYEVLETKLGDLEDSLDETKEAFDGFQGNFQRHIDEFNRHIDNYDKLSDRVDAAVQELDNHIDDYGLFWDQTNDQFSALSKRDNDMQNEIDGINIDVSKTNQVLLETLNKTLDNTSQISENKKEIENLKNASNGGASIDVTAEIGQTIVVKEVDENGKPTAWEASDFPEDGNDGKSAYEYAKDAGYTGTEKQFADKLASDSTGIHIGEEAPTDDSTVWIDTDEEPVPGGGGGGSAEGAVLYTEQKLAEEQQLQARTNIGAVSAEDVEAIINGETGPQFSETGDVVELAVEAETPLSVVSKIHRDSTWGLSNKLVLHQVSGSNFVDFVPSLGGVTEISKNGLTAKVNDDGTITIRGTNTSTGSVKIINSTSFGGNVYPAGTYTIPKGFIMQVRAAQYPNGVTIPGATGNLFGGNAVTISESFRIVSLVYSVNAGSTVDVTLPFGLFRGNSIPETGYKYSGNIYTVEFDAPVYEGEFNWITGELKDADGNTVAYYDSHDIVSLEGTNYFWTCFGENTVSNRKDEGKVILRLNETAPEETVPSICDFMLTPTTMQAAYGLCFSEFWADGVLHGREVPLLTTKGDLTVKNANGDVKYSKRVDNLINRRGVSDTFTEKGIRKVWSEKFYLNVDPINTVLADDFSSTQNVTWTWEFTEEDFVNAGIPAKLSDIPMASPCFYNADNSQNLINSRVFFRQPYPAKFSYNEETGKYTLVARGVYNSISTQLTNFSKVYFYYQLDTPHDVHDGFAMGISSGDSVSFVEDYTEAQDFIDNGIYIAGTGGGVTEYNIKPTVTVVVPRNTTDAMDGMENAARMLNFDNNSTGGDATVQGYSWIGKGDGTTDYTAKLQIKLDEIHTATNGGTVYLGSGTYPISGNLYIYDNTRLIGDGKTVIKQTADNKHAIVVCGSNVVIKDLTITLAGECTDITACVYVNSYNKVGEAGYDSNYPETIYAQNLTMYDVSMSGKYTFGSENGYAVVSDAYDNYKGVGIHGRRQMFNYAHIDNVDFKNLYVGVYGGGGSNYFKVTSVFCKYGLYIIGAGNNTYFVDGHSYYATNANGDKISMSDEIAHVESDTCSAYHLRSFDAQGYKHLVFLGSKTSLNKVDFYGLGHWHGLGHVHEWNIMDWIYIDYGRSNVFDSFKKTPFRIGNRGNIISKGPYLELSDPVIQNVLSGAGVWGNITSNIGFQSFGIDLKDVCRYPSEKTLNSNELPHILSTVAPSEGNPIEIVIDYSNRPVIGYPNYFIQFYHDNVASDYVVSFDTKNTGEFDIDIPPVHNNTNIVQFYNHPQVGDFYTTYRMRIRFTKALQIENLEESMRDATFNYNPNGLIGICNIGMTVNDYAGRSFLGECGGSLYGNVDMHQNTLKNLPTPVEDGDAVNKAYLKQRLAEYQEKICSESIVPIVSDISVEIYEEGFGGFESTFDIVLGKQYIMTINGTAYVGTAIEQDGMAMIMDAVNVVGIMNNGDSMILAAAPYASQTVSLSLKEYNVSPIPPQFLENALPYYVDVTCDQFISPTEYQVVVTPEQLKKAYDNGQQIIVRYMGMDTGSMWVSFYQLTDVRQIDGLIGYVFMSSNPFQSTKLDIRYLCLIAQEDGTFLVSLKLTDD